MSQLASPLESLALDLISIPSVTGDERAVADYIAQRLESDSMDRLLRAGDNFVVQPRPFREDTPRVLLLGHLDTVPPADDNPPRIEQDRIYGLGASDMKCAVALIIHLLERAVETEPSFDVAGVLYAREEGPFEDSGMPEVLGTAPEIFAGIGLAIAMEPTDNQFELGCIGTLHALVRFHGKRAHSARPWEGSNAIHLAAPFLAKLAALKPRKCKYDGLEFREVCSATMVEYDGARNVVPGRFDVNVNFRFAPDRSRTEAVAWLTDFIHDAMGEDAVERGDVTIEITDICPSGRVCVDNEIYESLREAAGPDRLQRAKQAWTDVGRLSEVGIDAINFGPGSPAQAHQAGEHCLRDNLEEARALLDSWLFA